MTSGSLPIIAGLIGIVIVFGLLEDQFLTTRNFTNLLLQMAPISFFAIGIVFILLIADGEIVTIDLSVAFVGRHRRCRARAAATARRPGLAMVGLHPGRGRS